jgi:deaminated glutathione amidase
MTIAPYRAVALQAACRTINACPTVDAARAQMRETIARLSATVKATKTFVGPDVKLVVLPEYFLTGYPMGDTTAGWREKAALEIDGPEYQALGRLAVEAGVYLAGNAYERDPHFPDLYFQCCFVLEPGAGRTVLRYRRLVSLFGPSPWDVWDRYLDAYGFEGVFPVAQTDIGKLAAIASEEVLYPELSRIHALRGAEVFLHSSSEFGSTMATPKDVAKRARAIDNLAYVVSANSGGLHGTPIPANATDGLTKIVDFTGLVIAEAGWGESFCAAEIDVSALRRYRARPGMPNLLARQPTGLYAQAFAHFDISPQNTLLKDGAVQVPTPAFYRERQMQVLEAMAKAGFF